MIRHAALLTRHMDELLALIREEAGPQTWSRGVQLARADAVIGESATDDEVILSVRAPSGPKRFQVHLYPVDEDWSCSCASAAAACEHSCAAVIAWNQARKAGQALPGSRRPAARLRYAFRSSGDELNFTRQLVRDGQSEPLELSLSATSEQREILSSDADLEIEALLGAGNRGVLPAAVMRTLLPRLEGLDLTLDEAPVRIGRAHPGMRAIVDDAATGVRIRLEQDPSVRAIYRNGALLVGETLCPRSEPGLDGATIRALREGQIFDRDRLGELVSSLLPKIEARIPTDIRTRALPRAERMKPRVALDVRADGRKSTVLATVVYGDPPIARVDGDALVLLGDGPAPIRDRNAESALLTRMRAELQLEPGQRVQLDTREALALGERVNESALRGSSAEALELSGTLLPALELSEGFELRFSAPGGKSASPRAVLEAWIAGEDHVPLLEGGFASLPQDWLSRYGHRVADLLAARGNDGSLPPSARVEAAHLLEDLDAPTPPSLAALLEQLNAPASLPSDLNATLRPYQTEGVHWLRGLQRAGLGGLLADDMGLGKTLQTICVLESPCLVVCPTSVLDNWRNEIERFRPRLTVNTYHGRERQLEDADVTLTTYAILRMDIESLSAREWRVAVLDEAQAIKNPDSQAARAAYQLRADMRLTLTGTPVENRLEELWSQMHFSNPGLLGDRKDFDTRYAKAIAGGDVAATERLQHRLRPFVLRRLKRDVAPDLPPRTDLVLHCDLDDEERAAYDAIRVATQREVVAKLGQGQNPLAALEALLRLRQAACHTGLLPEREAHRSSKLDLLMETLDEALVDGHKALVFSQWTALLDRVEPHLRERDISYLRLDGSSANRGELVERFQSSDGIDLMLVSLKAGGTGLNLTAADYVFLLDPWWNPAAEDQAADRAYRIGQDRPVFVHRLVARGTVEEKILALQEKKRALADAAVGNPALATNITRGELVELLA